MAEIRIRNSVSLCAFVSFPQVTFRVRRSPVTLDGGWVPDSARHSWRRSLGAIAAISELCAGWWSLIRSREWENKTRVEKSFKNIMSACNRRNKDLSSRFLPKNKRNKKWISGKSWAERLEIGFFRWFRRRFVCGLHFAKTKIINRDKEFWW